MSLICCPECGGKVSDKAAFCPHCGFPEPRVDDAKKYEIAFDGKVPKKNEYPVMTAIFNATGINIDEAQRLTYTENAVIQSGLDFETADKIRVLLKDAGAPAIMREIGTTEPIETNIVRCPACGSTDFEVYENGFSIGKAAIGAIVAGGAGALAGFSGANNRYRLCLKCGRKF